MISLFLLVVCCCIGLRYYASWALISWYKETPVHSAQTPSVSVVIAARNEAENLRKHLPHILNQEYPDFDVVVVNDGSTDNTADVLLEFESTNPRLKIVTLNIKENYHRGKKFAITMGLKRAQNEKILLTDADCKPLSNLWIKSMVSSYADGNEVVLGYGPYEKKKSLLSVWVDYETAITALHYLSAPLYRKPLMSVGRNLSYNRSFFFDNKGFSGFEHFVSGDDDILINRNAKKGKTAVQLLPTAFTESVLPENWTHYFKQKKRHASASKAYRFSDKLYYFGYAVSQWAFFILLIALAYVAPLFWPFLLFLLLARWILLYLVLTPALVKFKIKRLIPLIPLLDIFHSFLFPLASLRGIVLKQKTWN